MGVGLKRCAGDEIFVSIWCRCEEARSRIEKYKYPCGCEGIRCTYPYFCTEKDDCSLGSSNLVPLATLIAKAECPEAEFKRYLRTLNDRSTGRKEKNNSQAIS